MDAEYRLAMVGMRSILPKHTPPKVCLVCIGWEHFGGLGVEDVSNGPVCVCDKTWMRVQKWKKRKNKLLTV